MNGTRETLALSKNSEAILHTSHSVFALSVLDLNWFVTLIGSKDVKRASHLICNGYFSHLLVKVKKGHSRRPNKQQCSYRVY